MLELITDFWVLLTTLLISLWDVLKSAVNLVIIDDPFWCGVELTILTLVVWNNRKELISLIDRVPLLGALIARGLSLGETLVELILGKAHSFWVSIRSRTWDRLVSAILKADEDLRKE